MILRTALIVTDALFLLLIFLALEAILHRFLIKIVSLEHLIASHSDRIFDLEASVQPARKNHDE